MSANENLRARYRARDLQRKKNEATARCHHRANAADAETIRATLRRIGAVDTWECKRFDQARVVVDTIRPGVSAAMR